MVRLGIISRRQELLTKQLEELLDMCRITAPSSFLTKDSAGETTNKEYPNGLEATFSNQKTSKNMIFDYELSFNQWTLKVLFQK
jgi:hypothetical protein